MPAAVLGPDRPRWRRGLGRRRDSTASTISDRSQWRKRDLSVTPGNRLVAVAAASGKLCVGGERLFCGDERSGRPWNTISIAGSQVSDLPETVAAAGRSLLSGVPCPPGETTAPPITADPEVCFAYYASSGRHAVDAKGWRLLSPTGGLE